MREMCRVIVNTQLMIVTNLNTNTQFARNIMLTASEFFLVHFSCSESAVTFCGSDLRRTFDGAAGGGGIFCSTIVFDTQFEIVFGVP